MSYQFWHYSNREVVWKVSKPFSVEVIRYMDLVHTEFAGVRTCYHVRLTDDDVEVGEWFADASEATDRAAQLSVDGKLAGNYLNDIPMQEEYVVANFNKKGRHHVVRSAGDLFYVEVDGVRKQCRLSAEGIVRYLSFAANDSL